MNVVFNMYQPVVDQLCPITNKHNVESFVAECRDGHIGKVKAMVENGVQVNMAVKYCDEAGARYMLPEHVTGLYMAAHRGHSDIVEYLITKAHAKANIPQISPPLYAATRQGHVMTAETLLHHGADPLLGMVGRTFVRSILEAAELTRNDELISLITKAVKERKATLPK